MAQRNTKRTGKRTRKTPRRKKAPPKKGDERMRIRAMSRRICRVPIQEMRKKPVANVPRMEPKVEKA
jgi:hypothetical protein